MVALVFCCLVLWSGNHELLFTRRIEMSLITILALFSVSAFCGAIAWAKESTFLWFVAGFNFGLGMTLTISNVIGG
jgi:hypothetical protein